jgi:hypothetical protein
MFQLIGLARRPRRLQEGKGDRPTGTVALNVGFTFGAGHIIIRDVLEHEPHCLIRRWYRGCLSLVRASGFSGLDEAPLSIQEMRSSGTSDQQRQQNESLSADGTISGIP